MAIAAESRNAPACRLCDARKRALSPGAEAAGPAVLVDAAGVAANFQRMTRVADAVGIPVDDTSLEMGQQVRQELGIERFATARNSLTELPVT